MHSIQMRSIATGCSVVCVCVCLSVYVTEMSPTKTAEAIEMPFGMWARVGPHNHVLDRGPDPPRRRVRSIVKSGPWTVSPEKTAASIEMAFVMCT